MYVISRQQEFGLLDWITILIILNSKPSKGLLKGLLALLPHTKDDAVKIISDNICSVFYINKLGGTHSPQMSLRALDIWNTLGQYNITCHAYHLDSNKL